MDALLTRENIALVANVKLLAEKRKGQLAIAAIQDDIDLAAVAQRQLSDPNFSNAEAGAAREAIARRKITRELEEAEASAQDQITVATEARLLVIREQGEVEGKILAHSRKKEALEAEIADLRAKEAEAAKFSKLAEERTSGLLSKFSSTNQQTAREARATAGSLFSPEDSARLEQITGTELPKIKGTLEGEQTKLQEVQATLLERSQELGLLTRETDVLIENARGIADQKTKLAEIETTNREISQGAQEFSASLGQIEGLTKSVSEARQADKTTVESLATLMQEVTADGIVTQQELARINSIVTQAALQQGQATTETAAAVRNLQEVTRNLMGEISKMKAGQIQISRTGTR
jgi:chemotaxis protein MotB